TSRPREWKNVWASSWAVVKTWRPRVMFELTRIENRAADGCRRVRRALRSDPRRAAAPPHRRTRDAAAPGKVRARSSPAAASPAPRRAAASEARLPVDEGPDWCIGERDAAGPSPSPHLGDSGAARASRTLVCPVLLRRSCPPKLLAHAILSF